MTEHENVRRQLDDITDPANVRSLGVMIAGPPEGRVLLFLRQAREQLAEIEDQTFHAWLKEEERGEFEADLEEMVEEFARYLTDKLVQMMHCHCSHCQARVAGMN